MVSYSPLFACLLHITPKSVPKIGSRERFLVVVAFKSPATMEDYKVPNDMSDL